MCFYPEEHDEMREQLQAVGVSVEHVTVSSEKGHDSFLLEPHLFEPALKRFLAG